MQAALLTVIAGIADAVGFITMGGVFAANMTGNTVLAGIAAAQGRTLDAARHLSPLVAFFVGAMLARLLLRLWHKPAIPLLLEALIVAALAVLPVAMEPAVLILAFAMGLQAAGMTHFGGTAVSTVVVTSTLARTAEAALDSIWRSHQAPIHPVARPWLLVLSWAGYLAGAVIGAGLLQVMAVPLIVPALLLVIVVFL
ncbi:MAG TPA: YoaK family protein [Reyranella sp.]|nr:YoaK family protein [Reyranella sp.]